MLNIKNVTTLEKKMDKWILVCIKLCCWYIQNIPKR